MTPSEKLLALRRSFCRLLSIVPDTTPTLYRSRCAVAQRIGRIDELMGAGL